MQEFIGIGVDLAKNYFQVHALEREDGRAATRKLSHVALRLADDAYRRRPDLFLRQPAEQDPAPASMNDFGRPRVRGDPALLAR